MNARQQLLELQWSQLNHDDAYHKDIVILPLAQRIKHMALHNTKYTGYFVEALDQHDDDRVHRTLTDCFIILLSSANALNLDLGKEIESLGTESSLQSAGSLLAERLPRDSADAMWLVRQYARQNGYLAKLCESLDHIEALPFRNGMASCFCALLSIVLAEAGARGINLEEAYQARIRIVETRSIFDNYIRLNKENLD